MILYNTFHCSCPLRAPFCPAINLSQYYYSSQMPKQLHQTPFIETEFLTDLDSVILKLFSDVSEANSQIWMWPQGSVMNPMQFFWTSVHVI